MTSDFQLTQLLQRSRSFTPPSGRRRGWIRRATTASRPRRPRTPRRAPSTLPSDTRSGRSVSASGSSPSPPFPSQSRLTATAPSAAPRPSQPRAWKCRLVYGCEGLVGPSSHSHRCLDSANPPRLRRPLKRIGFGGGGGGRRRCKRPRTTTTCEPRSPLRRLAPYCALTAPFPPSFPCRLSGGSGGRGKARSWATFLGPSDLSNPSAWCVCVCARARPQARGAVRLQLRLRQPGAATSAARPPAVSSGIYRRSPLAAACRALISEMSLVSARARRRLAL